MVGHGLRSTGEHEGHNAPDGDGASHGSGEADRVGCAVCADLSGPVDAETGAGREAAKAEGQSEVVDVELDCHRCAPLEWRGFIPPAR